LQVCESIYRAAGEENNIPVFSSEITTHLQQIAHQPGTEVEGWLFLSSLSANTSSPSASIRSVEVSAMFVFLVNVYTLVYRWCCLVNDS